MALDAFCLKLIAPHIRGAHVLSLSYPDIIVPASVVLELLGVEPTQFTQHGRTHKRNFPLPETISTFLACGAAGFDCVDFKRHRGVERIVDLNKPQPWPKAYDLVLNPGTLEHCFNITQAWWNAWFALKTGGHILHVAPATMMNHGFWSMNPTLYFDFAEANGGEVVQMVTATLRGAQVPFEMRGRFSLPENCVLYCLMRKNEWLEPKNPVQWKYR